MQTFDDPDFEGRLGTQHNIPVLTIVGSEDGSSEDEQNYRVDDAEEEAEPEEEADAEEEDEGEGESDENNEGEDSMTLDSQPSGPAIQKTLTYDSKTSSQVGNVPSSLGETPVLAPSSEAGPTAFSPDQPPQSALVDGRMKLLHPPVRPEALSASVYDIVPTIAAPQSTSINTVTATPDFRWVFTGGSDGYIRRFNWADTVNGKLMLTVAQRHPFVDSVVKAGILSSYWENEEPAAKPGEYGSALSPVYSLAVHRQALWLLSGLDSGGINLQSVRHEEGKRIHCLKEHTSAVSVLNLAQDEQSVLSGSWDKTILDWDLNTGQVIRRFDGSGSQISAIEMRPLSSLPVPETAQDAPAQGNTVSSNNAKKPLTNGIGITGNIDGATNGSQDQSNGLPVSAPSPADSLFGGNDNDSLFGDHGEDAMGNGGGPLFGDDDEDNEFSRMINSSIQQSADDDGTADVSMVDVDGTSGGPMMNGFVDSKPQENGTGNANELEFSGEAAQPLMNGLPHAEDTEMQNSSGGDVNVTAEEDQPVADTVFLASSIDGSLRVWDKRKPTPLARILAKNTPPWCMGACWSPDGNFIYAGRRNGTVEEFSLHKGFRAAERTFRFPQGSGPVSAVRAMPNGRHLVWCVTSGFPFL